jgi:hypothetical protein
MPFIRGRYHVNPIMGEAVEAAREAEAARCGEPEHESRHADDQADGFASPHASDSSVRGRVQRVEIEATELVPSHSGRVERGFVARLHRQPVAGAPGKSAGAASRGAGRRDQPSHAETHVFADSGDLLNFLHHELARE